ncbi:hypothetical protein F383_17330 [Gossypium arboreum]|uniref:Uncharacterized protein n=1 Tax=Gossypium arboreum TaxID=29729 RepID=A0A0B0NGS8_GOSAR|nr:hypothetical protein F383_17330 [Gossypium arboreum]
MQDLKSYVITGYPSNPPFSTSTETFNNNSLSRMHFMNIHTIKKCNYHTIINHTIMHTTSLLMLSELT